MVPDMGAGLGLFSDIDVSGMAVEPRALRHVA